MPNAHLFSIFFSEENQPKQYLRRWDIQPLSDE